MAQLFISYRKTDRNLCLAMKDRLQLAGHDVWWDEALPPSKEWAPIIEQQLRQADAVIVLWTHNATRSKWVYFEAMMAAGMEKLLILKIGGADQPAGRLGDRNFYPFDPAWATGSEGWQYILRKIGDAVANGRAFTEPVQSFDDVTWAIIRRSREAEDFADYLSRYPDSPHATEARRLYDRYQRDRRRRQIAWWCVGLSLYATMIAPSVTLVYDYGWLNAFFWADLYFPFFAFDVLFGAMMVPIYCFTLAKALHFATRREGRSRWARGLGIVLLVGAPMLLSLVVTYIEVSDGYAPWQFTQTVLDTPLSQNALFVAAKVAPVPGEMDIRRDARSLQTVFEGTRELTLESVWDQRNRPLSDDHCLAAPEPPPAGIAVNLGRCVAHMNNLQKVMEAIRSNKSNWSRTALAYKYSFFFISLVFIGSYFIIFYAGQRAEELRAWMARLSPWSGQRFSQLLILLAAQLLCIAFWFIARLIYQLETVTILPSSGGQQFSQAIRNSYIVFLIVFFISIGFLFQASLRVNNIKTRIYIVGAALVATALFGLTFSMNFFIQSVQGFIGVQATTASTFIMALALIFVFFVPFILPNLLDLPEPDPVPATLQDEN